jgi:tRNA nucleotidyltransferase (CCA-adding enzyme)
MYSPPHDDQHIRRAAGVRTYLVGGAVRDQLLGLPVRERDWCVVGATPEEMLERGFRAVGKDFPVFLHPETQEEYALARTERKTGTGYHGFRFDTSTAITIEEDLARRDLTINAMARDDRGTLIDPYGGELDIEQRRLRHVSDAFAEDPVRVLRAARFRARFHELGFRIAGETLELMRALVANGEVDALVPDRVWAETRVALEGRHSRIYFETLRECGALERVLPEVDALFGVPQPAKWHPEIDTGVHTMMVLDQAERLSDDLAVRFAVLVHDLGKATTDKAKLPSHPGHEIRSARLIESMAERLPLPKSCRELALLVAEWHTHCHRAFELRDNTVLKLLERTDAFRRPDRFELFLAACEADARGRTGLEGRPYEQTGHLRAALATALAVDTSSIARDLQGPAVGAEIRRRRLQAIAHARAGVHQTRR